MKRKAAQTTVTICDNIIKLHLRGFSENEVKKELRTTDRDYKLHIQNIWEKFGIDIEDLKRRIQLPSPI